MDILRITIFFNYNYFGYLLNVSTAIGSLHQEFCDGKFVHLLASCRGKQAVPCMTQSIPPSSRFMSGVEFRIDMASLIHLALLLHSLSITFAPSQSMMQLIPICMVCYCRLMLYYCWHSLLFPGKSSGCDVFSLVLVFFESCSKYSPCFADIHVWLQLLQGIRNLSFCPLDALVFSWCFDEA